MEEEMREEVKFYGESGVHEPLVKAFSSLGWTTTAKIQANKIKAASKYSKVDTLKQQFLFGPAKYKDCYLTFILMEMPGSTIVFTRTCDVTHMLALMLQNFGLRAVSINGKQTQGKRVEAVNKFEAKECNILICTDISSRGLDIPSVDTVINYDIPDDFTDYKLRVGRTARFGRSGVAISLVNQYELELFIRIKNLIGKELMKFPVEEEKIMVLFERVSNAKRIAHTKMKKSGGKRRRNGTQDEVEEVQKHMGKLKIRCESRKIKDQCLLLGENGVGESSEEVLERQPRNEQHFQIPPIYSSHIELDQVGGSRRLSNDKGREFNNQNNDVLFEGYKGNVV